MKFRRSSMLRRALALGALALAVPAGAQASVVFDGDLETGNLSQWGLQQMCSPDRATVYSASSQPTWPKPISGAHALRFRVLDSDVSPCTPTGNPRAQIANSASHPGAFQQGHDRWQRFSVYFPGNFPKFMDTSSSDQWFLFQEDYGAPWNGSPPLSFGVVNDQLVVTRGAQYGYDWVWSKPLQRERWYTFIVHKRFAKDNTGFQEMWLDGVQQRFSPRPYGAAARDTGVTRLYTQTMHSDATGAYQFFMNSYRAKGVASTVDTFYDGMKVGTTRADVESAPVEAAPEPVAAPQAAFTVSPSTAVAGSPVQFDASTSKNAVSYSWSLDGRTTLTGVKPTFTFQNAGTKKVTLTVTGADGAKSSVTRDVVVRAADTAAPTAAFTFAPSSPTRGQLVQFDASASKNAVSYSWSLDGWTTLTGVKPTFRFQNAGTKKVTLTVTGADGAKASVTRDVVVR